MPALEGRDGPRGELESLRKKYAKLEETIRTMRSLTRSHE